MHTLYLVIINGWIVIQNRLNVPRQDKQKKDIKLKNLIHYTIIWFQGCWFIFLLFLPCLTSYF